MPQVLSVVMPAHNEQTYLEPAVKSLVAGLEERGLDYEVVVAENGSRDSTAASAAALAAAHPRVAALSLPAADYGGALRAGFRASRGEVVVNLDVDLVDVGFVDRVLAEVQAGADVVVGSKRAEGAVDSRGVGRRLVTAVFSGVLRHGFGLTVSDTHGLKGFRRSAVAGLVEECRFGRDIFDTELVLRAERAGLKVVEIPVEVCETRPPRTPIARRIPRTVLGLVRLRLALGRR